MRAMDNIITYDAQRLGVTAGRFKHEPARTDGGEIWFVPPGHVIVSFVASASAGADVNDYLLGLGAQMGKTPTNGGLKILSLGQGQGPIAERLMGYGRYLYEKEVFDWLWTEHRRSLDRPNHLEKAVTKV